MKQNVPPLVMDASHDGHLERLRCCRRFPFQQNQCSSEREFGASCMPIILCRSGLLSHSISERTILKILKRTRMNKSGEQAGGGGGEVLTDMARAVGSALGTVVGKVSKKPKAVRPKRSKSKSSVARRTKTAGKGKTVSKRRK